jgi:hypothetical protein
VLFFGLLYGVKKTTMAEEKDDRSLEDMSTYRLNLMAEEEGIENHAMMDRDELIEALKQQQSSAEA